MSLRNRIRDLAVILPIGALIIFLPPYIRIFDQPATILGIPVLPFAIFTAWLVGIVLTLFMSRALNREAADDLATGGQANAGRSEPGP